MRVRNLASIILFSLCLFVSFLVTPVLAKEVNFGTVAIGSHADLPVTYVYGIAMYGVCHDGTVVDAVHITGRDAEDFQIVPDKDGLSGHTLGPDSQISAIIRFTPNPKLHGGKEIAQLTVDTHGVDRRCHTAFAPCDLYANGANAAYKTQVVSSSEDDCPDLSASFNFATYVDSKHGKFPCCVEKDLLNKYPANDNKNGGLWFAGSDANGHKYLEINPLHSSSEEESASTAMNVFRDNFCTLFPAGGAKDITSGGNIARSGDKYMIALYATFPRLHMGPYQVVCSELSTYHLTLTAYGSHILEGTAIHGIFEDSCGRLWMFQQGRGVKDEAWSSSFGSRVLGYEYMWDTLASNLSKKLGG